MGGAFLKIPVSTAICLPWKSLPLAIKTQGTHKHPHPQHDRVKSANTLGFSYFSAIGANGEPDGILEPMLPILCNSNSKFAIRVWNFFSGTQLNSAKIVKGRLLSKQPESHLNKGGHKSSDKFI